MSEQRDDGIVPVNVLLLNIKISSCVKSLISLGIDPVNEFLEKSNRSICVKSPISRGIVDVNALL